MADSRPHTERWAYRHLYTSRIFELTTRLYPLLGRRGFHFLSRLVAGFYAWTQPAVRRTVRENLSLLSTAPVSEKQAAEVFLNFATTIADYVAVGAMSEEEVQALCSEEQGLEHIEAALNEGGAILATGHYGFFEIGAVTLGRRGWPFTVATLAEPSASLTNWRAKWRRRWGTETVEVGSDPFSSLQLARAVGPGRAIAVLADRPIQEQGVPVRLPNGHSLCSTGPALLSAMTGATVVPVIVHRSAQGGYRVVAKPGIKAQRVPHTERSEEITRCTRAIAESLFAEITKDPLQWYQFVPVSSDSP